MMVILFKINSPKIKGSIGEAKVNTRLNFLGKEYIVLNDILIKNSNGYTSQIDELVLSEYGIFVIETKNYKGWIFGNEKAENWTQVIYKEKKYVQKSNKTKLEPYLCAQECPNRFSSN